MLRRRQAVSVIASYQPKLVRVLRSVQNSPFMKGDRFSWWLPLCVGFAMFLALLVPDRDGSFILCVLLGLLFVSVMVTDAIRKKQRRYLSTLLTLGIYCALSAAILGHFYLVHTYARWLVVSHNYKAKVLAQAAVNGELKHVEWDGWGFAGAGNTTVYLVFDPTDSLSAADKIHQPGKFPGIPCQVPLVNRVERQWYIVRFYTDENWGQRNVLNCGSQNKLL